MYTLQISEYQTKIRMVYLGYSALQTCVSHVCVYNQYYT
jgi:hypothetical protein